jgi:O-antigen/teichoic acid export membrane protein
MVFTMIVNPYWSSFTEAYVKKDYDWIKESVKNILKIWFFIPIFLLIMLLISNWFYVLWVGDKVSVPLNLSISMAIYALIFTFNMIFNFFINGVGKIKIQMIVSVISMIINIPLSIFFAKNLNLGLSGVILATTVSIVISAILSPIQYYKIINLRAKGLWNR